MLQSLYCKFTDIKIKTLKYAEFQELLFKFLHTKPKVLDGHGLNCLTGKCGLRRK